MGETSSSETDLETWFEANGRDLPWRRTRDPWAVLVSEVMLQQTQVDRIAGRWPRFMERFPNPSALAESPVSDVIEHWSGLGYNRRAVNLHRCAQEMVGRFDGRVPSTVGELMSLPGIGPYTARAVAVFAFELAEAVVDTNVARILARFHNRELGKAEVQRLADEWVDGREPWRWNQALLDVGALFCRPRTPQCGQCPLAPDCCWRSVRIGRPNGGGAADPATRSAGVSGRQSTFEGSDRQGRGRLVEALRREPVSTSRLAAVMGWPTDSDRARRVAASLVADGLAEQTDGHYRLPG